MHTIRTRDLSYYTGTISNGSQVLLGWLSHSIIALVFDDNGALCDVTEYDLGIESQKGFGPEVEAKAAELLTTVKQQLGFQEIAIRVMPFFVDHLRVGIKLLPEDLEDYVNRSDDFSYEDQIQYQHDLEAWQSAENCVLKWGNEYDLDSDGYTI